MPWNFPYWQVLRFAAPILMAGEHRHPQALPNVTGCALAIEKLFGDAGLPTDVFRSIVVEADVNDITGALIDDDRIAAVSLTGSERAGAAVAASAGRAVKKSLLELGGSDPFVVPDDADLDIAVASAIKSRFINSGQSCLAAKRFVVQRAVADEFTRRFAAAIANATRYGLAARVWNADPDRALAFGHRITSGALFVNAIVSSDPGCHLAAPSTAATDGISVSSARPSSPTFAPMSSVQAHLP